MTFFSSLGSFGIEQNLDLGSERLAPLSRGRRSSSSASSRMSASLSLDELFACAISLEHGFVLAGFLDKRLDLGERLRVLAVLVRVRLHGRGRQERRQLLVVRLDGIQLVQHDVTQPPETGGRNATSSPSATLPSSSCNLHSPPTRSTTRNATSRETRRRARARRLPTVRPPERRASVRPLRDVAQPGEQPDGHAHARRIASRRAASSSGFAVAPSIQTSPPSKNSCFQIGTICFTRSIT